MSIWSVYMVETAAGHIYTGISTDVARRFIQHETGKGAKALRGKGPLQLLWQHQVGDRSEASKLEYAIKQLPRSSKHQLIKNPKAFLEQDL